MSDHPSPDATLEASRDPLTGEVFVPARTYAADGSLRRCEPHALAAVGRLYSWTRMGRRHFGQVDLTGGPRIQVTLLGEAHEIGADYTLTTLQAEDGRTLKGYARV